jgi:hypothetical protein
MQSQIHDIVSYTFFKDCVTFRYNQNTYFKDSGVGGGKKGDCTASAKVMAVWRCVRDSLVNSCGRDLN